MRGVRRWPCPIVERPSRRGAPRAAKQAKKRGKSARMLCYPMSSGRLQQRHRGYLEAEVPLQPVKQVGSFRIALCYPNLYFVGMSNLGFHSVYQMLNAYPDVRCERAFLPDDVDREDLERTGHPLTTVESGTELRRFHALAFSVSFEIDYLYVLGMLRLAG